MTPSSQHPSVPHESGEVYNWLTHWNEILTGPPSIRYLFSQALGYHWGRAVPPCILSLVVQLAVHLYTI